MDWKQCENLDQGWAIPGIGQQYYTQYYTGQKYAKLYNILYQYYTLYYTGQNMQNYTILYTNTLPSQVN